MALIVAWVGVTSARAAELAYQCAEDICTINPDNTTIHANLTETGNQNLHPIWSPDGTQIAFSGHYHADGYGGVLVVTPASSAEATQITVESDELNAYEPVWSPDGSEIAYAGEPKPLANEGNIYISLASGASTPVPLGAKAREQREPTWSPDGSQIAFARGTNIYLVAPTAGAEAHLLANGSGVYPSWSPDGTWIAAVSAGTKKVRVIPANGIGTPTELPEPAEDALGVSWSPDSSAVVYAAEDNSGGHVRVASTGPLGGGYTIKLPLNTIVPHNPSFSPDGTRIAFGAQDTTGGGDVNRIYVAPAVSGGEAVAVTKGTVSATEPTWKPEPGVTPGGGSGGGGGTTVGGAGGVGGSSGGAGGGSTGKGANPPATREPTTITFASFRHPAFAGGELSGGYVDCSLGNSTSPACHANGEATYVAPITHSLTLARKVGKSIVFAKGSVTVPHGKTKPLPLKITAAGEKLLKPGRTLKLTVTVVETAAGAKPQKETKVISVKVPKRH